MCCAPVPITVLVDACVAEDLAGLCSDVGVSQDAFVQAAIEDAMKLRRPRDQDVDLVLLELRRADRRERRRCRR